MQSPFEEIVQETVQQVVSVAADRMAAVTAEYDARIAELEERLQLAYKEQDRLRAALGSLASPGAAVPGSTVQPVKRKRGRPPKYSVEPQGVTRTIVKRGPGRPRKPKPWEAVSQSTEPPATAPPIPTVDAEGYERRRLDLGDEPVSEGTSQPEEP